jgi:hypothetical protein
MDLVTAMRQCPQTQGQSVYQHGEVVRDRTRQLIQYLDTGEIPLGWILPDWLAAYRTQLRSALMPRHTIDEYTLYHDCGKPYCPSDGVRKFPNHAEISYQTWLGVGGNHAAARLMRMDMWIHTMKAADVSGFCSQPEAPTLLLAGLAEIHANAEMFGGTDSVSFKIKWKQLDRRGQAICRHLFGDSRG